MIAMKEQQDNTKYQTTPLLRSLTTCIVGGGNSAHVLIPLLHEAGHRVHLLTRRPNDWKDVIECEVTDGRTRYATKVHSGKIHKKSSDPVDVIPDADIIILCMPVHQYRPNLNRLAPYINRRKGKVFVGTIYGQGGFNWMVHSDVEKAHNLSNIVCFAIGSIPWICRTLEYGRRGANYGSKEVNVVAITPKEQFDTLNEILLDDISFRPYQRGKFHVAQFISLTMSTDNQIIHPARCYALWKQSNNGTWPSTKDVPYFYRDFDETSADALAKLDADYGAVRAAIRKRFCLRDFPFMLSYLELENLNHKSGKVDILSSLRDSIQLASIKTPVVEEQDGTCSLNTQIRFFTDDIPYGLLIAKWLAQELKVQTPFVDEVIVWAQGLRGEHFLDENRKINLEYCLQEKYSCGIPPSYGIVNIDEIVD